MSLTHVCLLLRTVAAGRPRSRQGLVMVWSPSSAVEPVAEPAHADHVRRLGGIRLDLLPQVRHLVVNHPIGDEGVPPPRGVNEALTAKRPAAVTDEDLEEPELERCERYGYTVPRHLVAGEVDG